jgi:predicted metal-dependent peptidase
VKLKVSWRAIQSFRLHLWSFDTDVYPEGAKVFTAENLDEIMDWEPLGGGGTDFEANWKWMRENDIQPKKFIMFTDGYPFGSVGVNQTTVILCLLSTGQLLSKHHLVSLPTMN